MNYNNPYMNSYAQQTPLYQPYQPQMQVTKVNGENGARAFQMGANSSALLLDESGTMVWLCTTDGASYKTVTPYDISPHQIQPIPDFGALEARISKLEEAINANATNTATAKRNRNGQFVSSADATGD